MKAACAHRAGAHRWSELRASRDLAIEYIRDAYSELSRGNKHLAGVDIEAARHHLDELARAARPDGEDGKR